jgi:hypothetical protein
MKKRTSPREFGWDSSKFHMPIDLDIISSLVYRKMNYSSASSESLELKTAVKKDTCGHISGK